MSSSSPSSTVFIVDDFDSSSTRSNFFTFHGADWSTSHDSEAGYMLGSATSLGKNSDSSFEVTYRGTALSIYGSLVCPSGNTNCSCDLSSQDGSPVDTKNFSNSTKIDRSELFSIKESSNGNHTATVANCKGLDSLTIDYAKATIPEDAALSPGRQRIGVQNGDPDSIAYEGDWAPADNGWGEGVSVMRTPTRGASMSFTFVGTEIQVIGFWGHHDTTGRITLTTVIDNVTVSPSAHFDAVQDGPILPYYTFFEQISIPQAQQGNDQHTINVTVADLSGEQVFQFAQFIYTPTVSSLSDEEHLSPSKFVQSSTSSSTLPSTTSSSEPGESQSSSLKNLAGPIAGGIVGGAVAILLVVLIALLWRRKKQREAAADSAPTSIEHRGVHTPGPAGITPFSLTSSSPPNVHYSSNAHSGAFGSAMGSDSESHGRPGPDSNTYEYAPVSTGTRNTSSRGRGSARPFDRPAYPDSKGARDLSSSTSLPTSFSLSRSTGGTSDSPLDVDPPSYDDLVSSRTGSSRW